jgi:D-tyrosyl-tRNA(Tyr) deacylase
MRAVIQRVSEAKVEVAGECLGAIQRGLLVLLGIEDSDEREDLDWLVRKISQMRIFSDEEGKMNRHVLDIGGSILVISQFTLHASTKKGNRPSFLRAARPDKAESMYEEFCTAMTATLCKNVQQGRFGADMQVSLVNDGPVTILIDSRDRQ